MPAPTKERWPDDACALVRDGWKTIYPTAEQLAATISKMWKPVTRNAVIAPAHRMRLPPKPKPPVKSKPPPAPSWWTDERVATLKDLWCAKGYSMRQIARTMGTSRESVGGKIHREKLARGTGTGTSTPPNDNLPAAPPREWRERKPDHTHALHLSIMDLGMDTCRWPIADLYCGLPVQRGAYCGGCAKVAYQPVAK